MKVASLLVSCLILICVRADDDYSVSVSSSSVELGQPVTVSWKGDCSHDDWPWGCYDWVAPFQAGSCTDGPGRNTCYLLDKWEWVSDLELDGAGSWQYMFEGPGDYEFRFPYCSCCHVFTADYNQCDDYDNYGTSPRVRVNPPFDLSPFSPEEQYALGIVWVLFEGNVPAMKTLMSKPGSGSCSTCFCDLKSFITQVSTFGSDFDAMVSGSYGSLLGQVETVISDISAMVHTVSNSITDCDIDGIIGKSVSKDLEASTAEWLSGLKEVDSFFKIIINVDNVYTNIANIAAAWRLGNYFSSGVFTGRLSHTILSAISGRAMAAAHATSASNQHECMLRHPGGEWSPCNCTEPLNPARFPGNRCKPVSFYAAVPPTRVD